MTPLLPLLLALQGAGPGAPRVLDDFERPGAWTPHPADGVALTLESGPGKRGKALGLRFAFTGGGYAIARRALAVDLPANYAFSFWIRGEARPNTLEFKLEAVRLATQPGASVTETASNLGIHKSMLHTWIRELAVDGGRQVP